MQMPGKTNQRFPRKPTASFPSSRAPSTCLQTADSPVSSTKEASLNASKRTGTLSTRAPQLTDLPDVSNLGLQAISQATATTMKRKQSDGGGTGSGIDEASRAARGASESPPGWPKKVKRGQSVVRPVASADMYA